MLLSPAPSKSTVSKQTLRVTLVYAPQTRVVHEVSLTLNAPCTVGEALMQSSLEQQLGMLDYSGLQVGIWGRKVSRQQQLRDLDRVELYRPLSVDPKVARRERFVKQGSRAAGLFAAKRPGAKAGY